MSKINKNDFCDKCKKKRKTRKYCVNCKKRGHHTNECLLDKKLWIKEKKDEKNTDDIPKIFNLSSKSSIKYGGIYILHIPFSLIKHGYIVEPKKEYIDLVLDKKIVLNSDEYSNYRYLLSVINLINNPRIFYFILKYFPNILEQKIRVFGPSYTSMYNGESFTAKLIDFLKNRKCHQMYDEISP